MKKLLKWVFPVILGIVPTLGAEGAKDSAYEEDKSYLSRPGEYSCNFVEITNADRNNLAATATVRYIGAKEQAERDVHIAKGKGLGNIEILRYESDDAQLQAQITFGVTVYLFQDTGGFRSASVPVVKKTVIEAYRPLEPTESYYVDGVLWTQPKLPANKVVFVHNDTLYVNPTAAKEAAPIRKQGPLKSYLFAQQQAQEKLNVAVCTKHSMHERINCKIQFSPKQEILKTTTYSLPLGYAIETLSSASEVYNGAQIVDGPKEEGIINLQPTNYETGHKPFPHNIKSYLQAADFVGTIEELKKKGITVNGSNF